MIRGGVALAVWASGCAAEVRDYVPETGTSTVRAGDLDVAYFEDGDGPLVLLLHGFPDTAHTWDDLRPALADAGYHAVSPFMPGYAPTSVDIDDPDSRALGEDVLAIIDALGEDSAIVVGHDWGAYAAYAAAYLEPERVSALVTVAIPPPGAVPLSPAILWGARHFLYLAKPSGDNLMRRGDFAHVNELYARWSPTWDAPESELEPVKNAFAAPGCLDAALGYYRASSLSTPAFEAGTLPMPAMLVGGTDDGILPARSPTRPTGSRCRCGSSCCPAGTSSTASRPTGSRRCCSTSSPTSPTARRRSVRSEPVPVIETSLVVDAPPAAVWRVLTDFPAYPAWNPLTVGVDGELAVGARLRLRVMLRGHVRRVGARVLVLSHERELRWGGGVRPLVWVEHWVRLAPDGAGTRIDHGESFVGLLAGLGTRLLGLSPAPHHAVNAALGARAVAIGAS